MIINVEDVHSFFASAAENPPKEIAQVIQSLGFQSDTLVSLVTALKPGEALWTSNQTVFDCCGTGGSGMPRLNTGTLVAFLAASLGHSVAKFGGRAASGRIGSIDIAETLGLTEALKNLSLAELLFEQTGLVFLSAPTFYPQLASVAAARKMIPHKTIFNLIGPLLNPMLPNAQMIGTSKMEPSLLEAIDRLHVPAWVVSSKRGLDEAIPGETLIHRGLAAPETPTQEEIHEAEDLALNMLGKRETLDLFTSSHPVQDARDVLHGLGRPDLTCLVAWNCALMIRMNTSTPLRDLYVECLDAIASGKTMRFYETYLAHTQNGFPS